MHETGFLPQALTYLAAAALFVPLFQRIGLGSVLGYLVAGVAIGPWGGRLIHEMDVVREVSELGVVLLMFIVGLELNAQRLWSLRRKIFGLGLAQVAVTIAAIAGATFGLGLDWRASVVLGMAAAMSSTAIALQILGERNLMKGPAGQAAFSVSLFQDIAVVPLLLGLALLAPDHAANANGFSWRPILTAVGLLSAMVVLGRLLLRPLLRWIAKAGMREIFIAFALLLIVGSALLTESVGLSLAMGSFMAGVLLADSEYRMELEVDIEPFKGLLLGLFFIAVGMQIDVGLILKSPLLVLGLALGAVAIKILVLMGLGRVFRLCKEDGWVFALAISQVGEFAFVLIGQAQGEQVLDDRLAALANAVVAVSMLTTPLLFIAYDRLIRPRYDDRRNRPADRIEERNGVIVAGIGRFGQITVRMLTARGIAATVIDHDPNQAEVMGRFGFRTYYGDARRPDVLEAAGIDEAKLVLLAMDDPAAVMSTAKYIRANHPHVQIIARARGRTDARDLERMGVPAVRETLGSALDAAELALVALGEDPASAEHAAEQFRLHDAMMFQAQLAIKETDEKKMIELATQGRQQLTELLSAEGGRLFGSGPDDGPQVPSPPITQETATR